ncbi:MAG: MFS transporter [Chloroflexota bacterium]
MRKLQTIRLRRVRWPFNFQLNRNIWLVLLTTAVFGFTIEGGIYSVLFNIYLLRLDYGTAFIGGINSIDMFVFTLVSIPAGILGQRWGARRTMLLGISFTAFSGLLIPTAQLFPAVGEAAMLMTAIGLRGAGIALFLVTSTPYIMAFTSDKSRNTAFTLDSAAYGLAAFCGGLLGGVLPNWIASWLGTTLEDANAYRYPFVVVGVLLLLGVWLIWKTDNEPMDTETKTSSMVTTWRVMPTTLRSVILFFIAISILGGVGMGVPWTFSTVYLDDFHHVPTSLIGTFAAIASLVGVGSVLILPRLTKRWSLLGVTVVAYLISGITIVLIGAVADWRLAGLSFIAVMGLNNLRFTAYRIYTIEPIPKAYQSFASGLFNSGVGLGYGLMALVSGFLIAQIGYTLLFLLSGAIMLLAGLMIGWYGVPSLSRSAIGSQAAVAIPDGVE